MYNPYDHYFNKAQKEWYKARSAFKLEEIQQKFHIFDKTVSRVIDVWCAPWSWIQYTQSQLQKLKVKSWKMQDDYIIVWFDIKPVKISLPQVHTYQQDITDREKVQEILWKHHIDTVDCIISDMAPNTMGLKDIDAIRSYALLEQWFWMIEELLSPQGKVVVKLFMGPGFDEYIKRLKDLFGWKAIKVYKPDASRTNSKETYVIKV